MGILAAALRTLREAATLTQEELAERSGLSTRTVSDIERGLRRRLYADTAARLADALDLTGEPRDAFLGAARGQQRTSPPETDLPHPLDPLIGRSAEIDQVVRTLAPAGERRLLTVTGLGGTGKSRVAIEAAHRLAQSYDGRVRFVGLAAGADADRLPDLVATALGALPGVPTSAVARAAGRQPVLLVLDAFEHALPASSYLHDLLVSAGAVRALVTSRVRLRLPGETEIALGPLDPGDARRLFLDRAGEVPADGPVDDICAAVSRFPLGIEIAAGRARQLPLPVLRDRLRSDRSGEDDPVREAVAWSVAQCSDDERAALATAALFPAGCRLAALTTLMGLTGTTDVVPLMAGLADKGLVVVDHASRWRLLDVIRERALAPTTAGTRSTFVRLHRDLVEQVGESVGSEHDWFGVLRADDANIEQALAWAHDDGDTESLLRLATGMFQYWQATGALTHGRRWLAAGLDRPSDATSVAVRMGALWAAAWLAYQQGEDDDVERAARALDALATVHGDASARRNAATVVGMLAVARDQAGEAVRHLEEAVRLALQLDRPWFVATSQLNLAAAHLAAGDPGSARPLLADALGRYDALGDRRFHARAVGYLALTALVDHDLVRATALYQRSLAAFRELAEPKGTAEGLAGLANVAAASGDALRAATLAGAAERLHESVAGREFPLERRIAATHLGTAARGVPPEDWAAAWAAGRALDRDDAIDLALGAAPIATG